MDIVTLSAVKKMRSLSQLGVMALLCVATLACGDENQRSVDVSRSPVSVRGWIADIQTTPENFSVVKPMSDAALRADLFYRTNIYVEKAQFASGGMAESGAFMVLDVPPGNAQITFQVPGHPDAKFDVADIPPNADVLAGGLIITPTGVRASDPSLIHVRVPGTTKRKTGATATVAGARIAVEEVTLAELGDRRDYPTPARAASAPKPLATVR